MDALNTYLQACHATYEAHSAEHALDGLDVSDPEWGRVHSALSAALARLERMWEEHPQVVRAAITVSTTNDYARLLDWMPKTDWFTHSEELNNRVSHKRFMRLLLNERVYEASVDSNSYGEFFFITIKLGASYYTFFGLGYHDGRERNIGAADGWEFYRSVPTVARQSRPPYGEAKRAKVIEQVYTRAKFYQSESPRTKRGLTFEIIADLSDDDAAMTELWDGAF